MLYLISILAVFVGLGIYIMTKKSSTPTVINTPEEEKPSDFMNPSNDLEAYISAQMSAGVSASIAASASLSSSVEPEVSATGNSTRGRKPKVKKPDSAE